MLRDVRHDRWSQDLLFHIIPVPLSWNKERMRFDLMEPWAPASQSFSRLTLVQPYVFLKKFGDQISRVSLDGTVEG